MELIVGKEYRIKHGSRGETIDAKLILSNDAGNVFEYHDDAYNRKLMIVIDDTNKEWYILSEKPEVLERWYVVYRQDGKLLFGAASFSSKESALNNGNKYDGYEVVDAIKLRYETNV